MPFLLRTRVERVTPEQVALTVDGHARVQVRGHTYGFVSCAGERRWVWGAFDETFRLARTMPKIALSAWGIGGFARRTLQFIGTLDLSMPRPPAITGRVRWSDCPSPRLGSLSAQAIHQFLLNGQSQHEPK
jgi:hypothetical protein